MICSSENKFDSGCGWPAFNKSKSAEAISHIEDRSQGRLKTEVVCSKVKFHLLQDYDTQVILISVERI